MDDATIRVLTSLLTIALSLGAFVFFCFKWFRYRYVGNRFLYGLYMLVVCLFIAIVSNLKPIDITSTVKVDDIEHVVQNVNNGEKVAKVFSSLFEAIKMMGFGFDKEKASAYLTHLLNWNEYGANNLFGLAYVFSSLIAAFFTSVIVALTIFNSFGSKAKTFFKTLFSTKDVYYLFSDSNVSITAKLAEELRRDGHIVVIYLSRASQLTQVGTEFKDSLVSSGFDVHIETYGDGLLRFLFGKNFNKYFNPFLNFGLFHYIRRKVRVFGLFSNDETSIELASGFKKAIINNWHFCKIRRKIYASVNSKDDMIDGIKDPNFLAFIKGDEVEAEVINQAKSLLNSLVEKIGFKNVVNVSSSKVKKIVKKNEGKDFLGLLNTILDKKDISLKDLFGASKCKIKKWIEMLIKKDVIDNTIYNNLHKIEIQEFYSGQENIDETVVKDAINTLNLLSNSIGLKNVVNMQDPKIRKYIKVSKIGDSDFLLLYNHFLRDEEKIKGKKKYAITHIIDYSDARLKKWLKLFIKNKKSFISQNEITIIKNYRIFLTYQDSDIDIISHCSDTTLHIINTLSQYDIISSEFVLANQLTSFLNFKDIDYYLNIGKKIGNTVDTGNEYMHVTFFGFGKVNRPIFEKMTAAYQLWDDNKNKIHYHIVDKEATARKESVLNRYCGGSYTPIQYGGDGSVIESEELAIKLDPPQLYDISADCDGKDLLNYNTINDYIKEIFNRKDRFNRDGFEVFVISVLNTTSDIKIASQLRKAILEQSKNYNGSVKKSIEKTIIFVRVANRQTVDSFFGNNDYVKKQEDVDKLLIDEKPPTGKVDVPIVTFGENALMSTYVSKHFETITKYAIEALRSYGNVSFEEAEKQWLLLDKREAESNIATIYSLKTKLELFDFELNKDYELIAKKEEYEKFLNNIALVGPNSITPKMKKLAGLEHNRWVAAVSNIYGYGQMSVDVFLKNKDLQSKTPDRTLHVCMLSNEGLEILRNKTIKKYPDKEGKAWNLTLIYDIRMMQKIFETLKYSIKKDKKD